MPHDAPKVQLDQAFGRELQQFLYAPEIFSILGDEGTWAAGGCWVLSDALRRWIGPGAGLKIIASDKSPCEHVVVETFGLYIHSTGVVTEEELLEEMRSEELLRNPRLAEFDRETLRRAGVPRPGRRSTLLLRALRKRFGRSPKLLPPADIAS